VKYFLSFVEQNQFCIMMELIDGLDVEKLIQQPQFLLEEFILKLFMQLVSAVQYCQNNKIISREIKSKNILLTKDYQIKLIGFGISKQLDYYTDIVKTQIGTPI
jgi:NIMA (never in mitosis gene a)-related kinase